MSTMLRAGWQRRNPALAALLLALLLRGSNQLDQRLKLLQLLTPALLAKAKWGWSLALGWGPSLPLGAMQ